MKKMLCFVVSVMLFVTFAVTPINASGIMCNAYLFSAFTDYDDETGDEIISLIMYDSKGNELTYNCSSPLTVDGIEYTDIYEAQDSILTETYVSYTSDANNYITSINHTDFPTNLQANITINKITYSSKTISTDLTFNYFLQDAIVTLGIYDQNGRLVNSASEEVFEGDSIDFTLDGDKSYIGLTAKIFVRNMEDCFTPISDVSQSTIVSEVSLVPYGYVTDVSLTDNKIYLTMITPHGVETLPLHLGCKWYKNNGLSQSARPANSTLEAQLETALINSVIKYTANTSGSITSIIEDGYSYNFEALTVPDSDVIFDESDSRFKSSKSIFMDSNSAIFFIYPNSIEKSYVGMLEDIEDGSSMSLFGVYYDSKALDNNIAVINAETIIPAK